MKRTRPPKIRQFPAAKQRRLDELLEKNSDGTITPTEKERLERLVAAAEALMVANAQLLAQFAQSGQMGPPADAVPVTVWVTPEHTGR